MTIAVDCETDKEQHPTATTTNNGGNFGLQPAKPSICWSVIMPHHCQPTHPGNPACATFSSSLFYVQNREPQRLLRSHVPFKSSLFFCNALLNFCL